MKNRAQLAQELFELKLGGDAEAGALKIGEVIGHLDGEEALAVLDLVDAMHRDHLARMKREREQFKLATSVMDGLEHIEGMTLGRAAEIKAAQGDPIAIKLLRMFNSRQYRLDAALFDAAAEAHPDWVVEDRGYRFTGQGEPNEQVLVDWFQTTHPKQAKAIEAELDAE